MDQFALGPINGAVYRLVKKTALTLTRLITKSRALFPNQIRQIVACNSDEFVIHTNYSFVLIYGEYSGSSRLENFFLNLIGRLQSFHRMPEFSDLSGYGLETDQSLAVCY